VSHALELPGFPMVRISNHRNRRKLVSRLEIGNLALAEMVRFLPVQVILPELLHDLLRGHLALALRDLLDPVGKLLVHSPRQLEAEAGIHHKSNAALSRLRSEEHTSEL